MAWSFALLTVLAAMTGQQVSPAQPPQAGPVELDEVVITAEARADMARAFVGRVAAPARGRGLGRWKYVCPSVVNLEPAAAREIANRIAEVAHELGVEVLPLGCEANIVIVFTTGASDVARAMVEANPRVYHVGVGALNRGGAALRAYRASERPVRWWLMSVPIDSETGRRAIRIPGDQSGGTVDAELARLLGCNPQDCAIGAAPIISTTGASRLNSQVVDQLYKAIVIVDMDQVAGLNTAQLGDYLSLVSLAQIDPEAETGPFDTVLNLFEHRTGVAGLTAWDEAYLRALYETPSRRRSPGAQAGVVASIMNQNVSADRAAD
jgi:hypothetical protein